MTNVPTDVFLFANALHDTLHAAWSEAAGRAEMDQEALFALLRRFEGVHEEIGLCVRQSWLERADLMAALCALEARMQAELCEVRAGAFDLPQRAI